MSDVICLNFQGSKSNNVVSDDGTCYSLNAMHGHDIHVVCFPHNDASCYSMSQRQISMMVGENVCAALVSTDYKDPQIVCYETNEHGGNYSG